MVLRAVSHFALHLREMFDMDDLVVAFPVSGMVTIPVSMYQTVVTNIQNMTDAGIPVTMSALTAAATENCSIADDQVNDASTTSNGDEDVKTTINGTQTADEDGLN